MLSPLLLTILMITAGCARFPAWLASTGPTREEVMVTPTGQPRIPVIDITDVVARRSLGRRQRVQFSEVWSTEAVPSYRVGAGDVLEVSVWEAPPAVLFGTAAVDLRTGVATSRAMTFPEQVVNTEGAITVPFAGTIRSAGKETSEIEAEIARRLSRMANQPQVLVRVTRNVTSNATVVGEVASSLRMPLTAKGERLLDAIAAAGGLRQPVGKTTLQLSREGKVLAMPMDTIIRDPRQNIQLRPGDVLTAFFQPLSFTVLGASGKNEEINFEAQGISLAQALARSGGLQESRADARGVFVFRFEEPSVLEAEPSWPVASDGKIPVVYRIDLKDPRTFLNAQNFPVNNKDVIYVANAPSAELQKFLNILSSTIFSVSGVANVSR